MPSSFRCAIDGTQFKFQPRFDIPHQSASHIPLLCTFWSQPSFPLRTFFDFFFCKTNQLYQLTIVALLTGQIFFFRNRSLGTVWNRIVRTQSLAQTNVENTLEIVDTLGHFNHLIPINLDPSNTIIKIQIVIYVLRYLRRFIGQAVVSRYNIIPRQLAKSQKTKTRF